MGATGRLGRYTIVKHLASGGMAEVLLARASGIEGFTRHVVVKKIRPALTKDQSFVQMFLNEARLAAQLHHANIVQVHDIGQEGSEYFFAMEYVHGEDVRRLLTQLARRKEKIPFQHAVTIIGAAAVALHHAHEQLGPDRKPLGIVHRDVTPANILVGYDGNVKVVDFGIAKAVAQSTEDTQAGTLKGKASYMSPEQCTGGHVDRRSDVFALGIVLYELITTRRLFKAENDFLTMSAIVSGKVPPARKHRPDLPAELEGIIGKALALRPEDRYQTADAMRAALETFAEHARLRVSTSALAAYMKQQFGERPEPWLIDDNEVEMEMTVDFDGSASGLALAPRESVDDFAVPGKDASGSSPIMRARTKAITKQPSNKEAVAAVAAKPPVAAAAKPPPSPKPRTALIPPPGDKSKPVRRDLTPVPAVAAPRRKPITMQIPQTSPGESAGTSEPTQTKSDPDANKRETDGPWSRSTSGEITMPQVSDDELVTAVPLPSTVSDSAATWIAGMSQPPVRVIDPEPPTPPPPAMPSARPRADATPTPTAKPRTDATPSRNVKPRTDATPSRNVKPRADATPARAISSSIVPPAQVGRPAARTAAHDAPSDDAITQPVTPPPADAAPDPAPRPSPAAEPNSAQAPLAAKSDDHEGRDSAPSLPPPPVASAPAKLDSDTGSGPAKFAAPSVFPETARPASPMPEAWPGGSSAVRVSRSRTLRIAIAALVLAALAVAVFVVTRKSDTPRQTPTTQPEAPPLAAPQPPPEPITAPPPPAPTEPVASEPVAPDKAPVKRKPATKKKPKTPKWDPNALFPTKKVTP